MRDLKTKTARKAGGVAEKKEMGDRPNAHPPLGLLLLFGLGFGHELQVFTIALGLHAVAGDEP